MTVTIIVPTGEIRQARAGEYYQLEDATWTIPMSWTVGKYPIGIAHEIEVPEKYARIRLYAGSTSSIYGDWLQDIPLPRPKVKKWQWVMKDETELNGLLFTSGHYTDEEFLNDWHPQGWYHKIDETMIEVSDE
jgi:hypothetical protein